MEKIIHICDRCRKAKGVIPVDDILFFKDIYWCRKCLDEEDENWERLLECTD